MMRIRAIKSLLVEEIAGLRVPAYDRQEASGEDVREDESLGELRRAQRRALSLVVLSWVAIAVLFVTYQGPAPFLRFDGVETAFTLGILLIAVYSGFRLGQWEKYRAVVRLCEELTERQPDRAG